MPRRLSFVLAAFAAALASAAPAPAATPPATLVVTHESPRLADSSETSVDVSLPPGLATARVSVFVPVGYTLDVPRLAGYPVGRGYLALLSAANPLGDPSFVVGELLAADPAALAADPRVQACAPGPHLAALQLEPLGLPILVDETSGAEAELGSYKLQICPLAASLDFTRGTRIVAADLRFESAFRAPRVPGTFTWRAVVAAARADGMSPDETTAFEMRAAVPLPHSLTITAVPDRKRPVAVLRGRLTGAGRPRAGVTVYVVRMPERVGGGNVVMPLRFARTTTTRAGTFSARMALPRSATFVALAFPVVRSTCTGPSAAAGACVSETTSSSTSRELRVRVRAGRR